VNGDVERAQPRSNVRRFAQERFWVWRCPHCKSIHAEDEVDLAYYYGAYPFHGGTTLDWAERVVYRNMTRRLSRLGLKKDHAVLDYGCGSGALIRYMRSVGYEHAHGYDEYSEEFRSPERLNQRYDCIVSQDVIEHVADPWELLRTFDALAKPGALISIGTPNAEAVDLAKLEWFVHALHQPYHRHILSSTTLRESGSKFGWELAHYYPTEYLNTLVPFINLRFVLHYMQCFDNNMDAAFDHGRIDSLRLWSPLTAWYGLFGYFYADDTGVMVVFRKPADVPQLTAASPARERGQDSSVT
jgi:2-polyprenyl-3-methyl-5-hydroxy-6-metoxy-1,4-benzoquinol methylase